MTDQPRLGPIDHANAAQQARQTTPGTEQLLNLADRAERGPLSAEEAARLRAGLAHHCARAEEAERRLANLRSSYKTVLDMFDRAAIRAIENGKRADRYRAAWKSARGRAASERSRYSALVADYRVAIRAAERAQDALDEQEPQP
jgi:hypothetical protein